MERKKGVVSRLKGIFPVLLILSGIILLLLPFFRRQYQDYIQNQMLEEWKKELLVMDKVREKNEMVEVSDKGVAGVLSIPSIDLQQPVLTGASLENLQYSLATIEPAGEAGEVGNLAIAGHHSRYFGRHFNRLHEVEEGDFVDYKKASGETITYKVDNIFVVEAEDTKVLESDGKTSKITLITCYYASDGTKKRLVVQGTSVS